MEEEGGAPEEGRMASLDVYPNPNQGVFIIRSAQAGNYRLLNSTGQLIEEIQLSDSNNYSFEVTGLSSGLYFIQGMIGTEYVQQKVIVANP
jgi:hypothetical protein